MRCRVAILLTVNMSFRPAQPLPGAKTSHAHYYLQIVLCILLETGTIIFFLKTYVDNEIT